MELKKIAIIGRSINNIKFNTLWNMLDEAKKEEVLDYQGYSIDNGKTVTIEQLEEYDAFIYLACRPLVEDDRPYIRFTSTPASDEFINKITELNEKLFGKDDEEPLNSVEQECITAIELMESELTQSQKEIVENDISKNLECENIQKLKGFIIEINNKQACLSIDDIDKLKELCNIIERQNMKILDIVTE